MIFGLPIDSAFVRRRTVIEEKENHEGSLNLAVFRSQKLKKRKRRAPSVRRDSGILDMSVAEYVIVELMNLAC